MSETEDAGREVRDCYGRLHLLRYSAADRVGRESSPWLTWPPMAAVGLLQYGFGAIAPALMVARGWSLTTVFSLLAVWVICQAGVGFPVAFLRERRGLGSRAVMLLASVLCAVGPLALAHGPGFVGALIGYSVLGGAGAGFVYGGRARRRWPSGTPSGRTERSVRSPACSPTRPLRSPPPPY